ncbi:PadR family transcriptional regulator [Alcaligenaceae bacterium]|nr:PadR family transcriptional regulator [Alcaligenaceae bacterium]
MSLPHALLTALVERPCSGSELARRFDRSLGYFWSATHQQIYRELARLEDAGWIESLPPEAGAGRKRSYRILEAGRQELTRWVGQKTEFVPVRNELMVKLRAEAVVGPAGLAQELTRALNMHEKKLAHYIEIEQRDFSAPDPSRATRLKHLVLKAGIMSETSWIAWSKQALAELDSDT